MGCRRSQIGGDESGLKIVEGFAVNFLAEGNDIVNAFAEALSRARDGLLHSLQEAGLRCLFLLFFLAAK